MIYGNYLRDKYNNTAVKIADAEGVPCVMEYSKGKNLRNYEIYGNSVQDGTPSPDTPIEIQSVGDLVTDTASEYYGKYDVPITVAGKNLFDISKSTGFNYISGGLTNVISDGIIALTSSITSASASLTLGTFEPGTYYIKMESDDYSGASPIFINGVNSQLKAIGGNVVKIKEKAIFEIIVFPKQNVTYHFKNIQITKSDVATDYEPYKGSVTEHIYLNEPLRKVGDYADYIDFKNQKVVRNVSKQLLNITNIYKKLKSVIRIGCNNGIVSQKYDTHILSTIFNYNYDWFANTECIFHHNGTKHNYYWSIYWNRLGLTYDGTNVYRTDDTSQTPLTDSEIISIAKEWLSTLSDKEKEIYMILYTPTEEPISLPTLKTVKGTSIISVGTSVQPSNIKAKYVRL